MKEIMEGWKKKPPAPVTYVPESVYEATTQRADWPQTEARIREIYGQGWRLEPLQFVGVDLFRRERA